MDFAEHRHGAVSVVKPDGAITEVEADQFRTHLLEGVASSMGRLVLDASDIAYVDSAGIEALLDLSDRLAESGRSLKLIHVNETLREVFDLVEVSSAFECYDDATAAVRSFL